MRKINLRDVFPDYELDCYIEVREDEFDAFVACLTREIADVYIEHERAEAAYLRQLFRNKAHYSLNQDDGIEKAMLVAVIDPADEYERRADEQQLYAAIASLPVKQAKRIYAHFILGMSKTEIARVEGVAKSRISESISRGLRNMKKYLESLRR